MPLPEIYGINQLMEPKKTVGEHFEALFGRKLSEFQRNHFDDINKELQELDILTCCGQSCKHAIDATKILLAQLDTHPHVVDNILKGLVAHLEVVYYG